MFIVNLTCNKLNQIKVYLTTAGILAALSVISGIAPQFFWQPRFLNWQNEAHAQEFTPEEVYNYAKAGFEVELLRQKAYQEIKSLVNEPPPEFACDRPETIDNIPANAREIANNYCDRTQRIVRQNNLSVERFNELKNNYDRGGAFFQQVQQQLLNFQN